MRRLAALAVTVLVAFAAAGCDGDHVNAWLVSRGQAPLPAAQADAIAAELVRRAGFVGEIRSVDAARLGSSWRPGCPVGPSDLRLLRLSHHTPGGSSRVGELIVHRSVAAGVVAVFRTLFHERFPIERMQTVDAFGASDDASMAANNTSGFNCRTVAGSGTWSMHALGVAVDVNPLVNPYVSGRIVSPPGGAVHVDRSVPAPGKIRAGDVAVRAFAGQGWSWGGDWAGAKDYMHFSVNGR